MEEGSLRCDANVSIRPVGQQKLGTKTELKNMNTFRGVEKAIEYEVLRQKEVIETGGTIIQQTYLWDAQNGRTEPMRSKEDAHDYRYFPEPDLLPLIMDPARVEALEKELPELPHAKRQRFITNYGLTPYMAEVLAATRAVADYFERTMAFSKDPRLTANWVMGEVLRLQKEKDALVETLNVTPKRLGELLTLVSTSVISAQAAKKVFDLIEEQDKDPDTIIDEQGLKQISDTGALEKIVRDIIETSQGEVARYKAGELKLMGFFVGEAMKQTKGKGNPKEIHKLVSAMLAG
jgi:aspartyl-tRNA(Asn)/glutamyl-tRNA(Gln) amidotransferase subunit B